MTKIYKYEIAITDCQTIQLPVGATILCAQMQDSHLCLWADVDTLKETEDRVILVYGTGHETRDIPQRYISTVQDREFVWHVCERL